MSTVRRAASDGLRLLQLVVIPGDPDPFRIATPDGELLGGLTNISVDAEVRFQRVTFTVNQVAVVVREATA
jgi:hypothetical protein